MGGNHGFETLRCKERLMQFSGSLPPDGRIRMFLQ